MRPLRPARTAQQGIGSSWAFISSAPSRRIPTGFPRDVVERFSRDRPVRLIGNIAASGTAIIDRYAEEQRANGSWIVYTSADSVFQIAADEGLIPLDELYTGCETARRMLAPPHNVSRVIARPFVRDGSGAIAGPRTVATFRSHRPRRLCSTPGRRWIPRHGVGKVDDLFAAPRHHVPPHREQRPRYYGVSLTSCARRRVGYSSPT